MIRKYANPASLTLLYGASVLLAALGVASEASDGIGRGDTAIIVGSALVLTVLASACAREWASGEG